MTDEIKEKPGVDLDQVNELIQSVDKKLNDYAPKQLTEEEQAEADALQEAKIARAARKALDEKDQERSNAEIARERMDALRDSVIKSAKLDKENFDEEFFQDQISVEVSKAMALAKASGKSMTWKEVSDKVVSKIKSIRGITDEDSDEETEDSEDDSETETKSKKKTFTGFGNLKDDTEIQGIREDASKLDKLYSEAKKYESEGKQIPTEIVDKLRTVKDQISMKANSLPKEKRDKFWALYPHE